MSESPLSGGGRRLTIAQIAERLQVDRSTVYRRVLPHLRAIRVGRSVRYRLADLERYERQQEQAPAPHARPTLRGLQAALRHHGLIR